ncbi:hypothetical protein ACJX0J_024195 [Zea mays]
MRSWACIMHWTFCATAMQLLSLSFFASSELDSLFLKIAAATGATLSSFNTFCKLLLMLCLVIHATRTFLHRLYHNGAGVKVESQEHWSASNYLVTSDLYQYFLWRIDDNSNQSDKETFDKYCF